MALQGEVYFPSNVLPPHQAKKHRVVILTNSTLLALHSNLFIVVAIIRSAVTDSGKNVSLIPLHSIPITPEKIGPIISHNSVIETHQLFALPRTSFEKDKSLGRLPNDVLTQVLRGAQRTIS
jgi:hypothetical protein